MNPKARLLVVEDDYDVRRGTARLLESAGYAVREAASGEEARRELASQPPDLVLLDRGLPDLDGLALCRWIKHEPSLADCLVVVVSASYAASDQQAEGLEAGADGYICRPIANRELMARVEAYVRIAELTRSLRAQAAELQQNSGAAQAATLNLMEDAVTAGKRLEAKNWELQTEIAERRQAEADLHASRNQLRALTNRLQTVREAEATRIAREIHDELGQQLTGLKMDLRWIEHGLEPLGDPRCRGLLEKAVTATELVDAIIGTVQRIAGELRPAILDKLGLVAALRRETAQFQQHAGIACRFVGPAAEPPIPQLTGIACFRIFQESMTNVIRHAAATEVEVELQATAAELVLEIRDNGRGVPPAVADQGETLGLLGMRERAHALGGQLAVHPRATGGTVVRLWIPLLPA